MKLVVALAAVALLAACSGEATSTDQSDLAGGCRLVCPKCHPGEVCPMIACTEDCSGKPSTCVETMMCPIGYAWSQAACSCLPSH